MAAQHNPLACDAGNIYTLVGYEGDLLLKSSAAAFHEGLAQANIHPNATFPQHVGMGASGGGLVSSLMRLGPKILGGLRSLFAHKHSILKGIGSVGQAVSGVKDGIDSLRGAHKGGAMLDARPPPWLTGPRPAGLEAAPWA